MQFYIISCYYNLGRKPENNSSRLELLQFRAILCYNSGRSVITNQGNCITIQVKILRYYNSGQFLLQFKAGTTIWVDYYNSGLYMGPYVI